LGAIRQWIELQSQKSKFKSQNCKSKAKSLDNNTTQVTSNELPVTEDIDNELFFCIVCFVFKFFIFNLFSAVFCFSQHEKSIQAV
jgi:hypothetical protein